MSAECGKGWSNRCAESKGKVCRCKCGGVNHGTALRALKGEDMSREANYRVVTDCPEYLLLEDLGPHDRHLTITNDAENVVAKLAPSLNGRRLFYIDSEGLETELVVRDGKFHSFKPVFALPSGSPDAAAF